MNINELIIENKLILVPVLIILGYIAKKVEILPDKFFPLFLLIIGILLSIFTDNNYTITSIVEAIIQCVLVTWAAVLGNQIPKQLKKDK